MEWRHARQFQRRYSNVASSITRNYSFFFHSSGRGNPKECTHSNSGRPTCYQVHFKVHMKVHMKVCTKVHMKVRMKVRIKVYMKTPFTVARTRYTSRYTVARTRYYLVHNNISIYHSPNIFGSPEVGTRGCRLKGRAASAGPPGRLQQRGGGAIEAYTKGYSRR